MHIAYLLIFVPLYIHLIRIIAPVRIYVNENGPSAREHIAPGNYAAVRMSTKTARLAGGPLFMCIFEQCCSK